MSGPLDMKEVKKMKVAELKAECEARGIDSNATKAVLTERLEQWIQAQSTATTTAAAPATTAPVTATPAAAAPVATSSSATTTTTAAAVPSATTTSGKVSLKGPSDAAAQAAARAARFGLPAPSATATTASTPSTASTDVTMSSVEDKKRSRAERFGLPTATDANPAPAKAAKQTKGASPNTPALTPEEIEKLKKRAARFEVAPVKAVLTAEEQLKKTEADQAAAAAKAAQEALAAEQKAKRAARFAAPGATPPVGTIKLGSSAAPTTV